MVVSYFILKQFRFSYSSQTISSDNSKIQYEINWNDKLRMKPENKMVILKDWKKNVGMKCYLYEIVLN